MAIQFEAGRGCPSCLRITFGRRAFYILLIVFQRDTT
jgi:hypothetical protein